MTTHNEDLVSLEELRSVLHRYAGPGYPRQRPAQRGLHRMRPLLVAVAAVAALAGAGVAIAAGLGAFNGIGAAQHPQTGADVIDPATRAYMEGGSSMPRIADPLFDTARVVGQLPSGQNIYVIANKRGSLCFIVGPPYPQWNCEDPLSHSHPSTVFLYAADPNITPPTFGIAVDGVTAVSFEANGREVTVPVKNSVWMYAGGLEVFNSAMNSLTAHFADGTTVVQTH